jgi:hypothetical protein
MAAPDLENVLGLKRAATQARLNDAVKRGVLEKKLFRRPRSNGSTHLTPHYRIIK